jgi:hypothetical protein
MSSNECQDSNDAGNDSVFDGSNADTDDDLEQFSTDSDEISLQSPPSTDQHMPSGSSTLKCDNSVIRNDITCATSATKSSPSPHEFKISPPPAHSSSAQKKSQCEIIERQKHLQQSNDKLSTTTPMLRPLVVNYDNKSNNNNKNINKSNKNVSSNNNIKVKSNSSECVAINVVDYNNEKPSEPKSSSAVILEMPILKTTKSDDNVKAQTQSQVQQQPIMPSDFLLTNDPIDPIDPSIASTSRKWSKETLF